MRKASSRESVFDESARDGNSSRAGPCGRLKAPRQTFVTLPLTPPATIGATNEAAIRPVISALFQVVSRVEKRVRMMLSIRPFNSEPVTPGTQSSGDSRQYWQVFSRLAA